jgi:signal peptide peptidase SppA
MSTTTIFAITPEAAIDWQARKARAFVIIPKADTGTDEDESRQWVKQYLGMLYNQRRPLSVANGVATVHVNDFLGGDLTFLDKCLGASDYADIGADVIKAANDPAVKSIVLDINSGGGSAIGCMEIGRLIAEVNKTKPVEAHIERIGCSAAFAIACGARRITAAPSAMVGSVGVIATYIDIARMCEKEGVTPHVFTSEGADQKAAGNRWRTPTEAETADLQGSVDRYGKDFKAWVSSRRTMTTEAFRGQAVSGDDARRLNFVDALSGVQVVTKSAAAAPKATVTTPAPKATTPTPSMELTPEARAKGAAAFAAITNPQTRGPAVKGLEESMAAAAKPDFSFLHGLTRVSISGEYDRLGGLTEQSHKIFMIFRQKFCQEHKMTPEAMNGTGVAFIPEIIPAAEVKQRETTRAAEKVLPDLQTKLDRANSSVIARTQQNGGKCPPVILAERETALRKLNAAEKALGMTLTK